MKNNEILTQLTRIADALEMANVLNGLDSVPATTAPTEQVEPVQETAAPKKRAAKKKAEPLSSDDMKEIAESTIYTHEDLKKACLKMVRDDIANKPKLKALLAEYGANKAIDVEQAKLSEIITRINTGDF
jgi:hypothetical protein